MCRLSSLLTGGGEGGGGRGAESYGRKKAWASINLQSSLPAVQNVCSLKKSQTAKDRAQTVVVKFYGDKLSKITQIYCRNILRDYFIFCTALSGYKEFIFVEILLYEIQMVWEAHVKKYDRNSGYKDYICRNTLV